MFPTNKQSGALSRTTEYVSANSGCSQAALWDPTPKAILFSSATMASCLLISFEAG